jgi:hypothetical protein
VQNADTLFATVSVGAGASVGARSFTVTNAPPGGGTSASLTFTVLNHVPSAFSLAEPVNGDTIKLKAPAVPIEFSWHPSADLDAGDTLTYLLHLTGTPLGDSVTVKGDTSVSLATLMGDLLPHTTYVWTMSVTDGFDTVAAADTFSYTTSDSVSAVADKGKRIPTEYALHQNYPNPFNPSTVIEFDLPHQSAVTLVVYNLIGQEIARLVDGRTMSAGYQSVRFDASSLPSGAYLYRISADGDDHALGSGLRPRGAGKQTVICGGGPTDGTLTF